MTDDNAQGTTTPVEPPAQGTGNEGNQPANPATKPADASVQPGSKPAERPYFDPQQHVPRSRLNEVNEKARLAELRFKQELDAERKKVQALTGVTPASPEEAEFEAARKVLEKWYPGLAKLTDSDFVKKIEALQSTADQLQASSEQQWTNRGNAAFRELESFATKELGGELSDRGKRALRAAFIDYVSSDEEAGKAYVSGDTDVVKNFWDEYQKSFIAPVRRTSNANLINRNTNLRLPRGGGSAPNAPAPKKPDFTKEDDVHNSAWDAIRSRLTASE